MKVTNLTNSHLTISIPQRIAKIVGLFFLLLGGTMAALMILPYQLDCQKKSAGEAKQCSLSHPLTRWLSHPKSFDELYKAKVLVKKRGGQTTGNYLVRLYTSKGKISVTSMVSPSKTKVRQAVVAINAYIAHQTKPLFTIPIFYPWVLLGFILIFPSVGIVLLFFTSKIQVIFDKNLGTMTLRKKAFFSKEQFSYPLSAISKIDIVENYNSRTGTTYQVICLMKDGEEISLNPIADGYLPSKIRVANAISHFLKKEEDFALTKFKNRYQKQKRLAFGLFIAAAIFIIIVFFTMRS